MSPTVTLDNIFLKISVVGYCTLVKLYFCDWCNKRAEWLIVWQEEMRQEFWGQRGPWEEKRQCHQLDAEQAGCAEEKGTATSHSTEHRLK